MTGDPTTHDTTPSTPDGPPFAGASTLPADPVQYDSPRNTAARRKGLAAPYIVGGDDPDLPETLRRESRDRRLLVGMAIAIVLLGFVLGIVGALIGFASTTGDGVLVRWIVA